MRDLIKNCMRVAMYLVILLGMSEPAFAQDGLNTRLTAEQVAGLKDWINQTQENLKSALADASQKSIPEAYAYLDKSVRGILASHEPKAENLFAYYSLARAFKVTEKLTSAPVDIRLAILWSSIEIALQEIKNAKNYNGRAAFGINYSLFLMNEVQSVLSASEQLEVANFSLGLLNVDLASDPLASQFAPANSIISKYLDSVQNTSIKSDADRIKLMRENRSAYQRALQSLKGTSLALEVENTENPTVEYNRRVLRKNLSSSEMEIQTASFDRLLNLSASLDDQRLILNKVSDRSLTICSAAFLALQKQTKLSNDLIPELLDIVQSNQTPMTCRYSALLLSSKVDSLSLFEPLRRITRMVVTGEFGLFYPEGSNNMVLPFELNFAAMITLMHSDPKYGLAARPVEKLCGSRVCIGQWVITASRGRPKIGPVLEIDEADRISILGVKNKWLSSKDYFLRVTSLNGFTLEQTVIRKGFPAVALEAARMLPANAPNAYLLHGWRGKIKHLFENGYTMLEDVDSLNRSWTENVSNLEVL